MSTTNAVLNFGGGNKARKFLFLFFKQPKDSFKIKKNENLTIYIEKRALTVPLN